MSAPRTRKRLMDMLRRTTGLGPGTRAELEDAELWTAHGRAARALGDVERHAERVVAASTRQRAEVGAAVERARDVAGRVDAATGIARRLTEVLERIDVVALNAGLEGARSAEPAARALMLVSEELRAHVGRGLESGRELDRALAGASSGATDTRDRLEGTQKDAVELSAESGQLKAAAQEAAAGFADLESRLRRATGLDPETARLVAVAGDQARGLAAALSSLDGAQGAEALRALGPLLAPLAKLLASLPEQEPSPTGGAGHG